jgi:cold shock CspA family protein
MRYQGRITDWKDDRGFGFITPNGGGAKVFIHVSALSSGQPRPAGNELVTYELVNDGRKGPRAENVAYVGSRQAPRREAERRGFVGPIVSVLLVAAMGTYAWQYHVSPRVERIGDIAPPVQPQEAASVARFQCQGKIYCSEMTSCEEAVFYLKNCPGVKIDGDGDGIPCESQWCSR